jgi:hypothetical protein
MSKQDLTRPVAPQPGDWYEGFRNAFEDAVSAADLKTPIVVCHFPNLALALVSRDHAKGRRVRRRSSVADLDKQCLLQLSEWAFAEHMKSQTTCCSQDWPPKHLGLLKHLADLHPGLLIAHAEDLLVRFGHDILGEALVEGVLCGTRRAKTECTVSSRTQSSTEEELVLVSALFSAIDLAAGSLSRQIHPADNCCLFIVSTHGVFNHEPKWRHLHSGLFSSHFFLRRRHVMHPVLVRLLKFLFRFFGSDCADISRLSFPYPLYGLADLSSSGGLPYSR